MDSFFPEEWCLFPACEWQKQNIHPSLTCLRIFPRKTASSLSFPKGNFMPWQPNRSRMESFNFYNDRCSSCCYFNHIYSNHLDVSFRSLRMHLKRMMIHRSPYQRTTTWYRKRRRPIKILLLAKCVFFSLSFPLRWLFFASRLTWHHRKSIFTSRSHQ